MNVNERHVQIVGSMDGSQNNSAGERLAERTIDNEGLKATNRTLLQVPDYVHEVILVN
jgi:hypothetical protein